MIPYSRQNINKNDVNAVVKTLKSNFLTQGGKVNQFERDLIKYTNAKYCLTLNSCTSALHIACLSLGLKKNDIAWTSPISFVASANCAKYCGSKVDFVDINLSTGLISIAALKAKLILAKKNNKLPKVLIVVHFAGQSCEMDAIYDLSKKYKFKIIEDAAHSLGGEYKKNKIGSCKYSDITVLSFHPVKSITTGEGGAILTNSKKLFEVSQALRSHGITRKRENLNLKNKENWYYEMKTLGYNYRMSDIAASLGITQLKRLDKFVKKRNSIAIRYIKYLKNTDLSFLEILPSNKSSYHLFVIQFGKGEKQRNYF